MYDEFLFEFLRPRKDSEFLKESDSRNTSQIVLNIIFAMCLGIEHECRRVWENPTTAEINLIGLVIDLLVKAGMLRRDENVWWGEKLIFKAKERSYEWRLTVPAGTTKEQIDEIRRRIGHPCLEIVRGAFLSLKHPDRLHFNDESVQKVWRAVLAYLLT
jgi:hypothetical protein